MRWLPATPPPHIIDTLERDLALPRVLAHLLAGRGITTPQEAESFLHPTLRTFPAPSTLPQVSAAAARLATAIQERESILVWGDYDVDGITSTVLLLSFIDDHDGTAEYYLPHREDDGYGMNMPRVEQAIHDRVDLVVTVDCGTANHAEVQALTDAGVDVIVTDHHVLQGEHPPGFAFLNPQRADAPEAFRGLAGVGVAFLLIAETRGVLTHGGRGPPLKSYLDLVALGTIADMVPLHGLNRTLVYHGLQSWEKPARPGLAALKRIAGVEDRALDSSSVAFTIGPRLNAAGRLASASRAVELLRARSFSKGLVMARDLDRLNTERKELEARIFQEALAQVEGLENATSPEVIIAASEGWPKGVLGIVASRLVGHFHRPALVLGIGDDGLATGSARSIKGFNLVRALEGSRDLLERFGGHAMAAGLSLSSTRVDTLRERLSATLAAEISDDDLIPSLIVDMEFAIEDLSNETVLSVEAMAPFGNGNPEPRFLSRGVTVISHKQVGKEGAHLKLVLDGGDGRRLDAIAFRRGGEVLSTKDRLDLVYVPELRTWRGVRSLQVRVEDLRRSDS